MKVFLATPAYRGIVCPHYLDSLETTVNLLTMKGVESSYHIQTGCCYVQVARNNLVKTFLESDADKLVFLDDDISWSAKDVIRLIEADKPVVCGVYPVKKDDLTFPVALKTNDEGKPLDEDNMLLAANVPTGFLCIDRAVFEKIGAHYPHLAYTEKNDYNNPDEPWTDNFDYFPQGVHNGRWVGEDYAFCDLWTGIGGKIYVIPDMTFRHHSHDKTWTGNLWHYLTRLPGGCNDGKD